VRRRLAWGLWLTAVALLAAMLVLLAFSPDDGSRDTAIEVVVAVDLLVFPTVGLAIALRRPGNAIGWLFLAVGIPFAVAGASFAYVTDSTEAGGPLPAGDYAAVLNSLFPVVFFGLPTLLFLLFPTGRLPSPRWRVVVWMSVVAMVGAAAPALRPGTLPDAPVKGIANPLGVAGANGAIDVVNAAGGMLGVLALVLAVASLVMRFRRSHGVERLQLKWFASASLLFAVSFVAFLSLDATSVAIVGQLLFMVSLALIPISAGVAILRYRLYDIDVVINRALVYGSLTATLGAAYLASVLLVGLAVGRSGFAVAVSTLAVAALFRPARARIQAAVDRRFYRSRYDAARTLEAFGAHLRDELDLEALTAEIRDVVRDTVQPAHVSVWLR
jgi:hypothetical protein